MVFIFGQKDMPIIWKSTMLNLPLILCSTYCLRRLSVLTHPRFALTFLGGVRNPGFKAMNEVSSLSVYAVYAICSVQVIALLVTLLMLICASTLTLTSAYYTLKLFTQPETKIVEYLEHLTVAIACLIGAHLFFSPLNHKLNTPFYIKTKLLNCDCH